MSLDVDAVLSFVGSVFQHANVVKVEEPIISKGLEGENFERLLQSLDNLNSAIEFFTENKLFKNSDRYLSTLRSLSWRGVQLCDEEFRAILSHNSHPLPPGVLIRGGIQSRIHGFFPEAAARKLKSLARRLRDFNSSEHVIAYGDIRKVTLVQCLKSIENIPGASDALNTIYIPGAHPFIAFHKTFLRLAFNERRLSRSIMSEDKANEAFAASIDSMLAHFLQTGSGVLKRRKHVSIETQIYLLLDISATLSGAYHSYEDVLASPSGHMLGSFNNLAQELRTALISCLQHYEKDLRDGQWKLPKDGTVHKLTAQSLVFLKRLFDFQEEVTRVLQLSSKDAHEPNSFAELVKHHLEIVTHALFLATNTVKEPVLRRLFEINNFSYIRKTIRNSELITRLDDAFVAHLEELAETSLKCYLEEAWKDVLSSGKGLLVNLEQKAESSLIKNSVHALNKSLDMAFKSNHDMAIPDPVVRDLVKSRLIQTILEILDPALNHLASSANGEDISASLRYNRELIESTIQDATFQGGSITVHT